MNFPFYKQNSHGLPMAALGKKKATGRECPWPSYTAWFLSGNRRTPRRVGLTAAIGGADTSYSDKITVNHEVRLLSLGLWNW